MPNSNNIFNWLDYKSPKEIEWAVQYLMKKGLINNDAQALRTDKETIDDASAIIKKWIPERTTLLIKKMKAARSRRDNLKKQKVRNKKNYSFMMDVSIQKTLKKLAGDNLINETLEALINNAEDFKDTIKAELESSIKPPKPRANSLTIANSDKHKIKNLTLIKKAQELVLRDLLKELCRYEYAFEKINFTPIIFTDDFIQIDAKYKKREKIINKDINDNLGLGRLSLRMSRIKVFGEEITEDKLENEDEA